MPRDSRDLGSFMSHCFLCGISHCNNRPREGFTTFRMHFSGTFPSFITNSEDIGVPSEQVSRLEPESMWHTQRHKGNWRTENGALQPRAWGASCWRKRASVPLAQWVLTKLFAFKICLMPSFKKKKSGGERKKKPCQYKTKQNYPCSFDAVCYFWLRILLLWIPLVGTEAHSSNTGWLLSLKDPEQNKRDYLEAFSRLGRLNINKLPLRIFFFSPKRIHSLSFFPTEYLWIFLSPGLIRANVTAARGEASLTFSSSPRKIKANE